MKRPLGRGESAPCNAKLVDDMYEEDIRRASPMDKHPPDLDLGDVGGDDQCVGMGEVYPYSIIMGEGHWGFVPSGDLEVDAGGPDVVDPPRIVSPLPL